MFFFCVSVSKVFFLALGVRGGLRSLFFLVLGIRATAFFRRGFFCSVFICRFQLLFGFFWVPGDHGEGRGGAEAYDSGREAHHWGGKAP